jgi:hypothetical protein
MGRFYTNKRVDPEELKKHPEPSIHSIVNFDGDTVGFEPPAVLQDTMVVGNTTDSAAVEIPMSQVHYANIRKIDELKLLAYLGAGIVGTALGLIAGFYLIIWLSGHEEF